VAGVARRGGPGILSLAGLLRQHGEAVEADLAWRGVDLRDLWRPGGRLTWRRLGVLVRHLPPESATLTALRVATPADVLAEQARDADPARGQWSQDQMLAAAQLDVLRLILHVQLVANGAKTGKPPTPTPRPGIAGPKRRGLTAAQRRRLDPRLRPHPPATDGT
jgi:hypothetical protein